MKSWLILLLLLSLHSLFGQTRNNYGEILQTKVKIKELHQNLGQIADTMQPKIVYYIRNVGDADMIFYSVKASSGCVCPYWNNTPVPPQGIAKIVLNFDARKRIGRNHKTATIVGNFNDGKPIIISFEGEVIESKGK